MISNSFRSSVADRSCLGRGSGHRQSWTSPGANKQVNEPEPAACKALVQSIAIVLDRPNGTRMHIVWKDQSVSNNSGTRNGGIFGKTVPGRTADRLRAARSRERTGSPAVARVEGNAELLRWRRQGPRLTRLCPGSHLLHRTGLAEYGRAVLFGLGKSGRSCSTSSGRSPGCSSLY
jgi:hypothetical protein